MQVRSGGAAGGANLADGRASLDLFADLDLNGGQMAVHGEQTGAVVQPDGVAIEEIVAGVNHHTVCCGQHWRALGGGDVHAAVWIASLAVEDAAQSKRT